MARKTVIGNDTRREVLTEVAVFMPNLASVRWCPTPEQAAHFDQHQFQNRGHYLNGSRLAWSDMSRLHLEKVGDKKPGRKRPTPLWAVRTDLAREVILSYVENRVFVTNRSGSLQDRLQRCREKILSALPAKRELLQKRIATYRKLADSPATDPMTLREHEREIQNLDTEIVIMPKLPEVVNAVVFYYHRLCWNSPTVAESLGLRAPHVRQLLFRTHRVAQRIWPEVPRVTNSVHAD